MATTTESHDQHTSLDAPQAKTPALCADLHYNLPLECSQHIPLEKRVLVDTDMSGATRQGHPKA
eukprot:11630170-Ditylum_brightwellii.AAC.1